ncbi:MAG: exopolysaccharide biosynthesis protein [Erythrobacter sp.]|nr:exopolysaccharide biosynthesis protein [Erythrobacter sp.]
MAGSSQKDADSIGAVVDGIKQIASDQDEVAIGDLIRTFGDRSFAPLMLVLALVGISPVGGVPTVPTILAGCIALIAGQRLFGRDHMWLPQFITRRGVNSDKLTKGSATLDKIAGVLDKVAKKRIAALAGPMARRVVAGLIVALCLAMPMLELVPFAAAIPFLAIAVLSLAIMVRDGLVMLAGGVLAVSALAYGISWFLG